MASRGFLKCVVRPEGIFDEHLKALSNVFSWRYIFALMEFHERKGWVFSDLGLVPLGTLRVPPRQPSYSKLRAVRSLCYAAGGS